MRATPLSDPSDIAYVTVCLLVFVGIFGRRYFRGWLGRKTARNWPSAEATVQSTCVSVCVEGKMPEEIIEHSEGLVRPCLVFVYGMRRVLWPLRRPPGLQQTSRLRVRPGNPWEEIPGSVSTGKSGPFGGSG
jgi:hypothetical protein